jgi:hypothetical protein
MLLCLLFIAVSISLYSAEYQKSSFVSDEVWNDLKPYFLPPKHPAKAVLDRATQRARLTANRNTLEAAGFVPLRGLKKRMLVAAHPNMKGYLIKTFLDTHNLFNQDWALWKRRIVGAQILREAIAKNGYSHIFKVPQKWIYPLPETPNPLQGSGQYPQNFLLVVEHIDIYDSKKSETLYKEKITFEMLDALFVMLRDYRLVDSLHLNNIPLCKDGKIAFIDTEYVNTKTRKVPYKRLLKYLAPDMKAHWKQLIKNAPK